MTQEELYKEFDHQVQTFLDKGYPDLARLSPDAFLAIIHPLRGKLSEVDGRDIDIDSGYLPFVIVVSHTLIDTTSMMTLAQKDGYAGITKLTPLVPEDFHTTDAVTIPETAVYLLIGIDRGKGSLNVRPQDALIEMQKNKNTPITIDEGIAIVTHHPEFLIRNNCFSLLGSRHTGDKRVPAIWINGKNHPNLGWCWDGNPHTWLGSASCKKRVTAN